MKNKTKQMGTTKNCVRHQGIDSHILRYSKGQDMAELCIQNHFIMKKSTIFLLTAISFVLIIFNLEFCSAQATDWTWMKGSNAISQFGTYGTILVPAAGNNPGSRYGSISWTDNSGNLWLFGGYGYSATGTLGFLNDLWMYDI
ncbi:MAG: hypothetical protein HY840_13185, partial [Bacteroidetes bacterium]|nr:hypothetical protein [Bacteroidota bacterium]